MIVVIAILAAISIVAYNGIQKRAQASAASSALNQAAKRISLAQVDSSNPSPTCAEFYTILTTKTDLLGNAACAFTSNSTDYQYKQTPVGGPYTGYCITATNGTTSYNIVNNSPPSAGGCSGHSSNGNIAITNLHTNPSVESGSLANYGAPNSSTVAASTTRAYSGTRSVLVTLPTTSSTGTVGVHTTGSVGTQLSPNTTYNYSIWVYVPAGTVNPYISAQGGVSSSTCTTAATSTSVKDSWTRLSCNFTTAASGGVAIYVLNNGPSTSGMTFYVDAAMVTLGNSLYTYADGNTNDWDWNGTANSSTSTGPAL